MAAIKASNGFERMILNNILRYGWHSNSVGFDNESAILAYTVGFYHTYKHPELLVFGLSPTTSREVFSRAAGLIKRGCPLAANQVNAELLAGRSCVSIEVPKKAYPDFITSACWYYDGNDFPLYQVVWPSDEGHYPWHPLAADSFVFNQPVLGQLGKPAKRRSRRKCH